jgi:hypothetical protein
MVALHRQAGLELFEQPEFFHQVPRGLYRYCTL